MESIEEKDLVASSVNCFKNCFGFMYRVGRLKTTAFLARHHQVSCQVSSNKCVLMGEGIETQ